MDFDPNEDRYPDVQKVAQAVLQSEHFPEGDIDRLEIDLQPSGEAAARVWPSRAEEPETWAFMPGDLD